MSDFPVNEEREEIQEPTVQTSESSADDEFSTIFAAPTEHKDKTHAGRKKKRLLSVIAAFLAVAILIGGTVAVVKLIPEKQTEESDPYSDNSIEVTALELDDIDSVTVKNSKSTFKLVPIRTEKKSESSDDETELETVWTVEGTDKSLTSSPAIAGVVETAASLSAMSEITGRTESDCGFDKPSFVVDISTKEKSIKLNFGALSADGIGYYLQIAGEDKIYLVEYSLAQNFEFSLLDMADTTSIPGIVTDDVNVKYVSEGTLTSFDSITVSGKNFPQAMVIEPNNDSSELGQYFNYSITAPQARVADKVDKVFNLFVNGLTVSGAYALDVSAQSLKEVGLDAPYITATIKLGDYSLTYKIAKVDNEYCAVITNNSKIIHKVSASSIEFLDYNTESFYSNMAYLKSIMDLSNLTLTAADESYSFDIKYDKDKEDDQFDITYKGNKISSEFFQNFYQDFVGVTYTDFKEDCDISNIELSVTVTFLDGHKETVSYAKDSATKYACVINGKCLGRVSSADVSRLLKDIRNVAQNKDIP